jgi:hypothetical protein
MERTKDKTYVYIAGPYTGSTHDYRSYLQIDDNIAAARFMAARMANAGIPFFCPHLHSAHFEVITPDVPAEYWYELDMFFLEGASAVQLLKGWETSKGVAMELARARNLKIRYFLPLQSDLLIDWWRAA